MPGEMESPSSRPVATVADAEALAAHYIEVMDALVEIVEQETELVRAGRLVKAAVLGETKTELARLYVADTLRLRANQEQLRRIAPAILTDLVRRHDSFRALLQINLTVLATAHAVSEGIVRGVSDEMARKAAPQTYGATGRANVPPRTSGPPLAVSRSL